MRSHLCSTKENKTDYSVLAMKFITALHKIMYIRGWSIISSDWFSSNAVLCFFIKFVYSIFNMLVTCNIFRTKNEPRTAMPCDDQLIYSFICHSSSMGVLQSVYHYTKVWSMVPRSCQLDNLIYRNVQIG